MPRKKANQKPEPVSEEGPDMIEVGSLALATSRPEHSDEWFATELAPQPMEFSSMVTQRRDLTAELMEMVAKLPTDTRRYSPSAIRQWNGLTPLVERIIVMAIHLGADRRRAMGLAGKSVKKLQHWLSMGAKGIAPFETFRTRVLQAEGMLQISQLNGIHHAAFLELKTTNVLVSLHERRFADADDGIEAGTDLPFDQFTNEELQAYVNSGGQIVPPRFVTGDDVVEGYVITEETDELLALRDEVQQLRQRLGE